MTANDKRRAWNCKTASVFLDITERSMHMGADDRQVSGEHYKSSVQHWDFAVTNFGRGYLKGQVTKYVYRWRKKNGVQDLEKALHFLQKLDEVSQPGYMLPVISAERAAELNAMSSEEALIMRLVVEDTQQARDTVRKVLEQMIAAEPGSGYVDQG